jgi:hypothetical protein
VGLLNKSLNPLMDWGICLAIILLNML